MTLSIKPGWQRLASMLAGMSPADADAMIVQICHDDPALADWLAEQRFSFIGLIILAPVQLARLMTEVSDNDLILALRGLDAQQQQALVRQAKLDASCRVKVPVGQGLTLYPYRVLRLWRSVGIAYTFQSLRNDRQPREQNR